MDESIFTKLPEKQHGLPKRLQAMFPLLKDKVTQYEWDTEVIPGIRSIAALRGHTPRPHSVRCRVGRGAADGAGATLANMPAPFAKHPDWHGAIDADPVLAGDDAAQIVRPCRVRQGARHRLPLPAPRRWHDRAGWRVTGYTFVPAA